MSNYNNICPYAKFAHEAALKGGVDAYLKSIRNEGIKVGVRKGLAIGLNKGVDSGAKTGLGSGMLIGGGLTLAGLAVFEPCKVGVIKLKNRATSYMEERQKRKAILEKSKDEIFVAKINGTVCEKRRKEQ